jgi:heme/copper-type cytochrome/quinol oxidase subunit 3
MIVFILIVALIFFLLFLGYFWQRHQRENMSDDENYVEPNIVEFEESEKE